MNRLFLILLFLTLCSSCLAFGAGNIPSFAYLEGKAFRHGDIEDTLAGLAKGAGALSILGRASRFGGLDIKRVYFGNWLRDYSQAVDIASLKKMQLQTVINLCMLLGFLAHGYATHEFEVTYERLGVYLPTEHIDNPKGYGEGEDARKYDPRLRGPVDPRELEIDSRSGMKNYIANESGTWDTSKALVRRTLERCIHLGRQHRSSGNKHELYEAYRLLGQSLHTLEDFPAHSNFCELTLVSMGYVNVFSHVGEQVQVKAPNGKMVAPIVTGTFGSNDFIHSLLGEATDHLSEASVSDLNKEFAKARSRGISNQQASATLRDMFFSLPGGTASELSRDMEDLERIRAGPDSGGKRPEDMSPQELHSVLWQILTFRDSVVKKIEKTIEKIPGLGPLIEKIHDSISVFIFTTLEPYVKPLLKSASSGLASASAEVIDTHDQYEVFNDPLASDPTHSFLSKDHFNLILNETAGHLAKIIVTNVVTLVTKAWNDNSVDVNRVTAESLECLFHPEFHNPASKVQREMLQYMRDWVHHLSHTQHEILGRLTKESVREHRNIRPGSSEQSAAEQSAAHGFGLQAQHSLQGYVQQIPGVSQVSSAVNYFQSIGNNNGRRELSYASAINTQSSYMPPPGPPPTIMPGPMTPSFSSPVPPAFPLPSGPPPGHSYVPTFPNPEDNSGSHYAPPSGPPPAWGNLTSEGGSYSSPPTGYPTYNTGPQGYNPGYYQSGW